MNEYNEPESKTVIPEEGIVVLYFSNDNCNVCKTLKPKIIELVNKYNGVQFVYINTEDSPELAAKHTVFAIPTILLTIDGREYQRYNRNLSLQMFKDNLERYYSLYLGE